MSDLATTTSWDPIAAEPERDDSVLTLVVLAALGDPERVGESAALAKGAGPWVLGRQGTLPWVRRRPGRAEPTGLIDDRRLSREHLTLAWKGSRVEVSNQGRLPLRLNGRPADQCPVMPGDLLDVGGRLLLYVTRHPEQLPDVPASHPWGRADDDGLVGESPVSWTLRERIRFLGRRQAHVLVLGPSGVGKELVVASLHAASRRGRRPLVSRNAATIPESLADAELFGNLQGYPNPGMPGRPGLVGEADGTALFLDEFGELPLDVQARLLRVLDDGEYSRLGEARPRRSDLRLIAATNRSPDTLKHDVLARFPLRLDVPPLEARREDIPLLAAHLLRRIARNDPEVARRAFPEGDIEQPPMLSVALVQQLVARTYHTHVRELEALLWQSLTASSEGRLGAVERPEEVSAAPSPSVQSGPIDPSSLDPEHIQRVLDRHGGQQEPTWKELGLASRHVLGRLVKKHDLKVRGRSR